MSLSENKRFAVEYSIAIRDGRSIEQHAADLAVEQTVEIPHDCIPTAHHAAGIVGRIESITPRGSDGIHYVATISYRCDLTGNSVPQFFNVLFGNSSLKTNIRIVNLHLCRELESVFPGPTHGITGIRAMLGVYDRPLACTALKPLGLPLKQLAQLAERSVRGGVDIVKDDHGIADQHFHPFRERVLACHDAVERANAHTGHHAVYCPMVNGNYDQIEAQVAFCARVGVKGILLAPMLVGPGTVSYLAKKYGLIILAHPALTGTYFHDPEHGIKQSVLLGTMFRLIGADVSIFPNQGGRFSFSSSECGELCSSLRSELLQWKSTFPAPAGGMQLGNIGAMAEQYGVDTVLLISGALMQYSHDREAAMRAFMNGIENSFTGRRVPPTPDDEAPLSISSVDAGADFFKQTDFKWNHRTVTEYKTAPANANDAPRFKGITRQTLTGKFGEKASFELRYFEIEPGGFSSRERHQHEHVIIGVRGSGVLVREGREDVLEQNDIAHIKPMDIHQLQNRSSEPFGFYCIVDRMRDKPEAVAECDGRNK